MSQYELCHEYTFEEALAVLGLPPDAAQASDVIVAGDRLLFFYDYIDKSKDWRLQDSDRFTWRLRWYPFENLSPDTKPRGEWCSNIQVSHCQQSVEPSSLRVLLNQSSRRTQRDKAVSIPFFLRYTDRQQYAFVGELYFFEATHFCYDPRNGFQTKLDPPENERVFEIDPRLPEPLWFQLTGRRWELCIDDKTIYVGSDDDAVAQVSILREGDKVSGHLTRYRRDYLHFFFAGSQATISYSEFAYNLFSTYAFHPIDPAYTGNPGAKTDTTEFVNGPDMLEVWPAEAIFNRNEAVQIIEAYIREGHMPNRWKWRAYEETE